jgi:peptidoglycan hydrolase-like protein with peptidoglycan-binding domain
MIQIIFLCAVVFVFIALILALLGIIGVVSFSDKKYLDRLFYGGISALVAGLVGFMPYVYSTQKFSAVNYMNHMEDVRNIQKSLAFKGYYSGDFDGVIGPDMFNAIAHFQRDNKLSQTNGQIDKQTIDNLFLPSMIGLKTLADGKIIQIDDFSWSAFTSRVQSFQNTLSRTGCLNKSSVDGVFGPLSKEALICFQRKQKMKDDGELGIDTLLNIIEVDLKFI